jgi:hypothetical protein
MELPHLLVRNYGKSISLSHNYHSLLSREAINIAVLEMSEDGALNNLKKKWWYDRSECHSGTIKVCCFSNN